ncbi:type II toxin-antitoxin system VapC family toxin [Brevundimonas sp.]|uniref:type II toxin-antitoxin system VapC family toxin n=1 Tax=Brevundimonas sp. TaxID=1871086 RepID=UPI003A8DD6B5
MDDIVLDASAVLAALNGETGGDAVEAVISRAVLSSVNLAEVVTKLVERGMTETQVSLVVGALGCRIADFDAGLAYRTGALRTGTQQHGLSLGDRACLALAQQQGLPVMTADRIWSQLDVGITIDVIR